MASTGFTSFLTGITEPLEFSFLFLAPALYAVFAGTALVVADTLNIKHGFGFSAGLIDYLVNYPLATNPLLVLPVGLVFAAAYFFVFWFAIRTFDLASPGRTPRSQREKAAVQPSEAA